MRRLTVGLLCLALVALSVPHAAEPTAPSRRPPKLALVLSGGGARGAAHIGVLKVLEELHVVPDILVGTSMGSVVGGLYAAGWSPEEIEGLLETIKWDEVFVDRPARAEKSFRRKQDDAKVLIQTKLRFRGAKPYLPAGFLGGQRLETLLRSLEIESTSATDFDELPIPYRAVAADIVTGETVVLRSGSLADAMRASMSVPGAFPPVEIGGRSLVDGGSVANLPIGIAQATGAEAVIAVDITSPLSSEEDLGSLISIIGQVNSFLTVGNRLQDLAKLRPGDVVVKPELGDISFSDFKRTTEAVGLGETAARAVVEQLRRFSSTDEEWARFQARHHKRREALVIDDTRISNTSWVDDEVVRRQVRIPRGATYDPVLIAENVSRLGGLEYFGVIRPGIQEDGGRTILTLDTPRKRYGRNSLQFGLSLLNDFQGDASYSFAVRHLLLAANRRAGEWVNVAQTGSTSVLSSEFYQPLDLDMRWFVAPAVEYRSRLFPLWSNEAKVAEYEIRTREGRLALGRVLGTWGELRATGYYAFNDGEVNVGTQLFPPYAEHDGGIQLSFRVDALDSTVFPRHGTAVDASYSQSLEDFGADVDYKLASLMVSHVWTFGLNTINASATASSRLQGPPTLGTAYFLGGFLRLSGLGENELIGDEGGVGRLIYYRELTRIALGALSPRVYAGLSLETGNVYNRSDSFTWNSLRYGGSVFVGAETPIGPIYLAYGMADGGRNRSYLILGERF